MLAVPATRFRRPAERETEDEAPTEQVEEGVDEDQRATYADLRDLENELFLEHARGLRDASRRLLKQ